MRLVGPGGGADHIYIYVVISKSSSQRFHDGNGLLERNHLLNLNLVVEPQKLKNMIVRLEHFPKQG